MVHGANKSGSRLKKFVRVISGVKTKFVEKRPTKPKCICGKYLHGTARGTRTQINKLSKTQKRPSRPFGGQLCSTCSRQLMKTKALSSE